MCINQKLLFIFYLTVWGTLLKRAKWNNNGKMWKKFALRQNTSVIINIRVLLANKRLGSNDLDYLSTEVRLKDNNSRLTRTQNIEKTYLKLKCANMYFQTGRKNERAFEKKIYKSFELLFVILLDRCNVDLTVGSADIPPFSFISWNPPSGVAIGTGTNRITVEKKG